MKSEAGGTGGDANIWQKHEIDQEDSWGHWADGRLVYRLCPQCKPSRIWFSRTGGIDCGGAQNSTSGDLC